MKPIVLSLFFLLSPLAAQQPAAPAPPKEPAAEEAAPASAPAAERWISGSVDVGYRVRTDTGGSQNTYRSLVDLGEGPKLFGADLSVQDPSKKLFDRLDILGLGWGDEPYTTARVDARRSGLYRFLFDYRNLAYFNFLPSFADPTVERGILLNQRSFDIHRRNTDLEFEIMPGRRLVPYFAYTRGSGFGDGITTYVADFNEFPVATRLRDHTDNLRGGARVELNRFHLTLEGGGTLFEDNQRIYTSDRNAGNRTTPFLGERLLLNRLEQAYRITGESSYCKGLVSASPASWASLYGQFLYSQPSSNVQYSGSADGRFVLPETLRFFGSQQDLLTALARQPHSSGSLGAELRPLRRLRVHESWMTDRMHVSSSAALAGQVFFTPSESLKQELRALDRLVYNYSRQQVDVMYDLTSRITLRGGHRYVWGDAQARSPLLAVTAGPEAGELRQHVALLGVTARPLQRLNLNADYEAGMGDRVYFRTSLYDYHRLRARARYQVSGRLLVSANLALLDNENPTRGIEYDFQSRSVTLSAHWTPLASQRISFLGEYTRAELRSDLNYPAPDTLRPERSYYKDNANIATGLLDINLPAVSGSAPKVSVGGSLFLSRGSRATDYYQPVTRIEVPVHKQVQWFGEWRWYGYSEPLYLYEGFRTHVLLLGLRLKM